MNMGTVLIPYESGNVSDTLTYEQKAQYIRLNPLRIRERFRLKLFISGLLDFRLNPLRIRERFRHSAFVKGVLEFVLIPYESGNVSDSKEILMSNSIARS